MCLYVLKGNKTPKIVKENITIWKRFEKYNSVILLSPYRQMKYRRNTLYTTNLGYINSYRKPKLSTKNEEIIGTINIGFHAYINKKNALLEKYDDETLVQCTIPKVAKYHLGDNGEIISDKIYIGKIKE